MPLMTPFLTLRAFRELFRFDLLILRSDFATLYETVRRCSLGKRRTTTRDVEAVTLSIDMACIWYWKEVLCLQRSAATVCLLKQLGVPAQLVIGAQQMPFKAHAWVELHGRVINDKSYTPEMYAVLDRC